MKFTAELPNAEVKHVQCQCATNTNYEGKNLIFRNSQLFGHLNQPTGMDHRFDNLFYRVINKEGHKINAYYTAKKCIFGEP